MLFKASLPPVVTANGLETLYGTRPFGTEAEEDLVVLLALAVSSSFRAAANASL